VRVALAMAAVILITVAVAMPTHSQRHALRINAAALYLPPVVRR
jgi:hypothetical protein